jgi:hypothetical protein
MAITEESIMLEVLTVVGKLWLSDRFWAIFAIVLGLAGIARSDYLFHKLYKRAERARRDVLKEMETVLLSYAAFSRAMQFLDLAPQELSQDGAFALLTSFYVQQQLHHGSAFAELAQIRKNTRNQMEKSAREYGEMLIKSGLATLKAGCDFNKEC